MGKGWFNWPCYRNHWKGIQLSY